MKQYALFLLLLAFALQSHAQNQRTGKDFALFFAVENYTEWDDLRKPIDDAEEIAQDLEEFYGFQCEVIRNPDRNTIYDKLAEYAQKSYAEDAQLLIFFSGHGDFEEQKGEGFFIPSNGKLKDIYQDTYIPHGRLRSNVDAIPCKHILLAIDACFSGTFDESIAYKGRPGDTPEHRRNVLIENSLKYYSRLYLTSGGKERTPDPSQFAARFKEGLRAFGGEDGILEFGELYYNYLKKAKPEPKMGEFGRNEAGGSFLFVHGSIPDIPKPSTSNVSEQDKSLWDLAVRENNLTSYETYLRFFPEGAYKTQAEQILKALKILGVKIPEIVRVNGGSFMMGCQDGRDINCEESEKPTRRVNIRSFGIGKYEVTVLQFKAFIDVTNYKTDADKDGSSYCYVNGQYKKKEGVNWQCDVAGNIRSSSDYNYPVIHVSWNDVIAYCKWLSEISGKNYRLPTEAEWEFAARGGNKSKNFMYAGSSNVDRVAWYWKNSNKKTYPVGKKRANELGIYDMSGNVWEWCEDIWHSNYQNAPMDARAWLNGDSSRRVLRGGSMDFESQFNSVFKRYSNYTSNRDNGYGFRIAQD